ncbi:MAG: outer membrane beta-barrel protein [Bacteroidota bacterium]
MRRKFLLIFITIFSGLNYAFAQSTNSVNGFLTDSLTGKPASYVTIVFKSTSNQVIKILLSTTEGMFIAEKLPAGKLTLAFISVEFQHKNITIILKDKGALDLGNVLLSPSSKQLKGTNVTATRPLIKQEADRIAYDLQADPESKSSSVLEMMRKVPLLSVDADDNIQLAGNSAFKIFINGKPSSLVERSPAVVLKSMPASSIQKIEVITTPSSKYDAEGLAGIINIITNKAVENGYNGNLTLSERFPLGGPSLGGNFTTKSGKLGLSVFGGGGLAYTPTTGITINRIGQGTAPANLLQSADRESNNANVYLGSELSYEIDSLNLLSGQLNLNGNNGSGDFLQHSLLSDNTSVLQQYDLATNNENAGRGADAALNFQRAFKHHKGQLLTASYRFYGFDNSDQSDQLFSSRLNYNLPDFQQRNESRMSEHTAQLDFVYPIKKISIEAGLKGIFRTNESDFKYYTRNSEGNYLLDADKTNTFNNNQTILAAYNTFNYTGKLWSVKAGLRLENTTVDADFVTTLSQVSQHYLSVVPAITFSRQFKSSSFNFGWNQRIQRPGINQLNPFIDRTNPIFENTGNPDLMPTKGNQFRIGYNLAKKGNLNISLMYNWIKGLIFQVSDFNEISGITRTRYENTGGAKALGGNINLNYPLSKIWNVSLNGNLVHGWANGVSGGKRISNQGFMYNFNLSTGLRLDKGWRLNGSAYLNGGELTVQQNTNAFVSTAFSVNKDLIKDKLSFSAFANNPFNRYRINVTNRFGPNFTQVNHSQQNFLTLGGSLSYKFGKLKDAVKKSKRSISNDDVSN